MTNILKGLNPDQLKAVTTTNGSLLVIAGAGTGKTTVIARRIAYLIEKKLAKPAEILALTFTDKAAAEMEERVDVLVPYGFIDTWISTFHAFGDRVLRDNALEIGLSSDFKIFSKPQQVLFLKQNLFRIPLDYWRPLANPTKFIFAILSFISRLKDENINPVEFKNFTQKNAQKAQNIDEKQQAQRQVELALCYESYEKFKEEAGFLDFGDQVIKTINLFKNRPSILKQYQKKFKYILVDEFQDTNYAQNELVKMLALKHKNICVVGDDDQSIYKFRGAAISNILKFTKDFKSAKQVVLTKNYRSTQPILNSAYKLIHHNDPDRLEIKNKINKKLKSGKEGPLLQEIFADTISEEADTVAKKIEDLITKYPKRYKYRDFAVLVRANSSADHFLRSLNMRSIPHKFVGATGLYQQEEISGLISFISVITNLNDNLNLFNLITSQIYEFNIKDAVLLLAYSKRKNRSLFYVLENLNELDENSQISKKTKNIITNILEDIEEALKLSNKQNVGRILYNFLQKTKYLEKLEKEESIEGAIKIQNISKFFEKIKEFEQIAKIENVFQFIDYLEALRDAGDDPATSQFDPDTDAVNVMTVHSAKGLEFPVVFMVNLVADNFPTRKRGETIEVPQNLIKETLPSGNWHIQEERRLFYVGMTRAKDLLYFSYSKDTGNKRLRKVSPFVLEALDKPKVDISAIKLSPIEKIEKFAPIITKPTKKLLLDTRVLKLTQGAIDDYLTCAYKYRYVHLLKIPILRHHAIVYGSALHETIAVLLRSKKQGKLLKLTQMLEVFENNWDSEGFLSVEHEEKRKIQAKLALSNFYKREVKSKIIPTFIEYPFKFSINDVLVVGRFDRVDITPSKISIIDYKSSENINQERADAQAKESTQLAIYALYFYKKNNALVEKATLHFLENGIEGIYRPTLKDLEKTEKLILETAQAIRKNVKNNYFKANPKYFGREPACTYCAYSSICQFSLAKIH